MGACPWGLETAEDLPGRRGGLPVLKVWDKGSQLEGAGGSRDWGAGAGLSIAMPIGILGQKRFLIQSETQQRCQKWCFEIDL